MKQTIILLVLFAALGLGAMKYLQSDEKMGTVSGDFEMTFAIPEEEDIHKVFIADRKGNTTTLTREGEGWILNGKHPVRERAMENLLDAMTRVRVKFRPAASAVDYMVQNLSTVGIKVEAFGKDGKKLKGYYVGGSSQDENGTTMILEDSEEPLVAYIPNWVGTIFNRFSLIGDEWRDRNIFGETVEEIQSVKINYPEPDLIKHSFIVEREKRDKFSVKPLYPTTKVIEREVSQGMIEAFLVQFERKIAEGFKNEHKDREQISSQLPFAVITLTTTSGEEKRVKFFPIYPDGLIVGKDDTQRVVTNRPVFRYFADVNGEDFVMVQQGVFGELFWSYDLFFGSLASE